MSVVIKTNAMKYKDSNGNYQGFNAIAQESTDQQIANITSVGQAQVNNIQQKGSETLDSIPDDYTELAGEVSDLKSQLTIVKNEVILEYTLANDLTINGYIKSDGAVQTQSSDDWKVSDYVSIPDACSGVYVMKCYPMSGTNLNIAFYNSSKTYIADSGQQLNIETGISGSQSPQTITIPEGAKFVRFGTHKATADYHGFDAILLIENAIEDIYSKIATNLGKANQALGEISAINTELGEIDFSLANDLTNNGYIDSNGAVQSSADWRVSDLISIPNSCTGVYVSKCYPLGGNNLNIAFYKDDGVYITGSGQQLNIETGVSGSQSPKTITIPENAKFVRFGTHKATADYHGFDASFVLADIVEDIYKGIEDAKKTNTPRQLISDVLSPLVLGTTNVKIKLVGDSITAGVGGTDYDATQSGGGDWIYQGYYENIAGYCWANMLKSYWQTKFNCTVHNYGMSGRKSGHLVNGLTSWLHNDDDIVICMIGTNDRNAGETDPITGGASTMTTLYNNLHTIVDAVQNAGKKIILMSNIPAYNETNQTFHMEDVDHVIMKVASEYNMEYVSVYKLMLEYCKYTGTSLNDDLLADGLHPNDAGYLVMFRLITNALGISPKREDATWND